MSGTLPAWISRLLGIDSQPGEGALWNLQWTWNWPAWATLGLIVFAAVFVVGIYLRPQGTVGRRYRLLLAGLRLGVMALVLVMIAQFSLGLKRTGLPFVALLIDDSQSMTVADHYDAKRQKALTHRMKQSDLTEANLSRWNLARTLIVENDAAMLRALMEDYRLRVYFLHGEQPSSAAGMAELQQEILARQPIGQSSRLGGAVRTILDQLRGATPAAIVMLTDGINTEGPSLEEAAAVARQRGVPLFAVGLGSEKPVRDLKLSDLLVDPIVFLGDVVQFDVRLTGVGLHGQQVALTLRREGEEEVMATAKATIGPDGQSQLVRLAHRPSSAGQIRYQVEVEPQPDEPQTENNRLVRVVEVRKEKIRVLLVRGTPSYEFRFLENLLRRDETIELQTVLHDADQGYLQQDPLALRVFPVRREELLSYDVVILGDVDPGLLSRPIMQNLVDFVSLSDNGGSLVLIAGPRHMPMDYRDTPLAEVMPFSLDNVQAPAADQVLTEGFRIQATARGLAHPAMQLGDTTAENREIWETLPPVYWLLELSDIKPAARVLAEHPTRLAGDGRPLPVICLQYVGAGKVLFHATEETWRWRRRLGHRYLARYWLQMSRSLSRSKLSGTDRSATLSADRQEYDRGDAIRLRVRFADERLAPAEDDGVIVVVEQPGRKSRRVPLHRISAGRGTFEAVLDNLAVGKYHAWVAVPTTDAAAPAVDFAVVEPPGEFEQIRMDATSLRRAAKQTKGRFYTFEQAGRLWKHLPPGRQVPVESLPPKPLWNKWPLLLLTLTLLITEWILRKRGTMV